MTRKTIATKEQSPQRLLTPSAKHPLRQFLRKPFQIVRDNFRAYLIINAISVWLSHHRDGSGDGLPQPRRNSVGHPGR